MMAAPHVSVIIPTRNRSATLVDAVESVLRQTYRSFEAIVVDDASEDDTPARAGAFGDPVRYRRLADHGGPARARNVGLAEGRGELVAFLDDDDVWEPEKLARQVALLEADPSVDLVHTGYSILDDEGRLTAPPLAVWQTAQGPLRDRLFRGCFMLVSSVAVRRACLDRAGGFDERRRVAEDYDLWLRLGSETIAACLPEPLVCVRRGASNLSVRHEALVYETSISILRDVLASDDLGLRQRLSCRTAISDLHARAAALARRSGTPAAARRHALSAVVGQPLNRRAWRLLPRTLRGPEPQ